MLGINHNRQVPTIGTKEQILPKNFYSTRKAKNFWITVSFRYDIRSFSINSPAIFGSGFFTIGDYWFKGQLKISVSRKIAP